MLVVSLVVYRSLGMLGVEMLAGWQDSAAWALATMLVFTGSAHFTKLKADFIDMVPEVLPNPEFLVHLTGASWPPAPTARNNA